MAASSSSSPFFGFGHGDVQNQMKLQHPQIFQNNMTSVPQPPPPPSTVATADPNPVPPQKRRRNQPGQSYPDAEVIALSPKTLMATNRFICEVCNKGFQREQNLQLHRRGHNLPWKLKQKSNKDVRRRVYLCPEPTCVHHDPSRALGDLTGIKKHFSRKHGEKKWKCDKCSKRYAVQSDWKAHSKTCGTREYRCDCGTIFSRRDSFITHRAFCDALAQENFRLPAGLGLLHPHFNNNTNIALGLPHLSSQLPSLQEHNPSPDLVRLAAITSASPFDHLVDAPPPGPSPGFFPGPSTREFSQKTFHGLMHLPGHDNSNNNNSDMHPTSIAAANLFELGFYNGNNQNGSVLVPDQFDDGEHGTYFGNMMNESMINNGTPSFFNPNTINQSPLPQMSATALLQKAAEIGSTTTTGGGSTLLQNAHMQDLIMNSLGMFGGSCTGSIAGLSPNEGGVDQRRLHQQGLTLGGSDGLTRDFLGVGGMMTTMGGDHIDRRNQQQQFFVYPEIKSDPQIES